MVVQYWCERDVAMSSDVQCLMKRGQQKVLLRATTRGAKNRVRPLCPLSTSTLIAVLFTLRSTLDFFCLEDYHRVG